MPTMRKLLWARARGQLKVVVRDCGAHICCVRFSEAGWQSLVHADILIAHCYSMDIRFVIYPEIGVFNRILWL